MELLVNESEASPGSRRSTLDSPYLALVEYRTVHTLCCRSKQEKDSREARIGRAVERGRGHEKGTCGNKRHGLATWDSQTTWDSTE